MYIMHSYLLCVVSGFESCSNIILFATNVILCYLSHTKKVLIFYYYTDCACTYVTPCMPSAVISSTIHELLVTQMQSISSRVGTGTYMVMNVQVHMPISYMSLV